jgi:hypothetical protein
LRLQALLELIFCVPMDVKLRILTIFQIVLDLTRVIPILEVIAFPLISEQTRRDFTMILAHSEAARSGGDKMIDSGFRDVTGRVKHLLAASPIADLRHIKVVQQGDQVLLQGRVRSFYAKQMAQETVRRAINGMHLVNAVSVD